MHSELALNIIAEFLSFLFGTVANYNKKQQSSDGDNPGWKPGQSGGNKWYIFHIKSMQFLEHQQ